MIWIKHRGIIPERTEDCPYGEFGALVVAMDCNINCTNCFNQHLKMSRVYGETPEMIVEAIKRNPLHTWCVLGGLEWSLDPFGLVFIAEEAMRQDLKVIVYTGLTFEKFLERMTPLVVKHLRGCYVKCGPYVEELRTQHYVKDGIHLASSNQDLILIA